MSAQHATRSTFPPGEQASPARNSVSTIRPATGDRATPEQAFWNAPPRYSTTSVIPDASVRPPPPRKPPSRKAMLLFTSGAAVVIALLAYEALVLLTR